MSKLGSNKFTLICPKWPLDELWRTSLALKMSKNVCTQPVNDLKSPRKWRRDQKISTDQLSSDDSVALGLALPSWDQLLIINTHPFDLHTSCKVELSGLFYRHAVLKSATCILALGLFWTLMSWADLMFYMFKRHQSAPFCEHTVLSEEQSIGAFLKWSLNDKFNDKCMLNTFTIHCIRNTCTHAQSATDVTAVLCIIMCSCISRASINFTSNIIFFFYCPIGTVQE